MAGRKRLIKFNIKNVHYAKATEDDLGNITYETPVPLPGAVSLTLSPEGDKNVVYADGIKWYVAVSNQGYSGSLENVILPDKFRTEILGEKEDETAHVLVEDARVEPGTFALLFQIDRSDGTPTLFIFYNCTATRPSTEAETDTATKTNKNDTLSLDAAPTQQGYVRVKTTDETPAALRKNWFKQVWKPGDPLPADPEGTVGELNVICAEGTESGKTAVAVDPTKESGNIYRIKTAADVTAPVYDADCSGSGYQDWDGSAEIAATTGDKLLVVECTAAGKARKAGTAAVTAKA